MLEDIKANDILIRCDFPDLKELNDIKRIIVNKTLNLSKPIHSIEFICDEDEPDEGFCFLVEKIKYKQNGVFLENPIIASDFDLFDYYYSDVGVKLACMKALNLKGVNGYCVLFTPLNAVIKDLKRFYPVTIKYI